MSIIGTGIAAGVANTANQAQQSARADHARSAAQSERASQADKLMLSQLHDASAARDTDQELPDQQAPGYENLYAGDAEADEQEQGSGTAQDDIHFADAPVSSPTGLPIRATYGPHQGIESESPLFRCIDVKG